MNCKLFLFMSLAFFGGTNLAQAESAASPGDCHFEAALASAEAAIGEGDEAKIGHGYADCLNHDGDRELIAFDMYQTIQAGVWFQALASGVIGDAKMGAEQVLGTYTGWDIDFNLDGYTVAWLGLEHEELGHEINLFGLSLGFSVGYKEYKIRFVRTNPEEMGLASQSLNSPIMMNDELAAKVRILSRSPDFKKNMLQNFR